MPSLSATPKIEMLVKKPTAIASSYDVLTNLILNEIVKSRFLI